MQSHNHNIQIYTADAALQAEDAVRAAGTPEMPQTVSESSLAHFCAFVDFYTCKASDPMSTSLACEKQAEAVELTDQDVTSDNMRMLMDTLLETIDHLEKKWLDEQLKHEDRQRQHREDVAGLYVQLRDLQPAARQPWLQRSMQTVQGLFGATNAETPKRRRKQSKRRTVQVMA